METDHVPAVCPYGHPLGARRMIVGWSPCQCPPALARHRGHRTYLCLACRKHNLTSLCYEPYHVHVRTGNDTAAAAR